MASTGLRLRDHPVQGRDPTTVPPLNREGKHQLQSTSLLFLKAKLCPQAQNGTVEAEQR